MVTTLHSLALDAPLDGSGESLVLVELIVPRPAIARRATLKPVRLRQGRRSLAREPFYERVLLKERVEGPFGLKVSITRPLPRPELSRLARQLLATGVATLPDFISSTFPLADLIEDLAEEATDPLADRLTEDPRFLASGGRDLDSIALRNHRLTVPLRLTRSIRSSDHIPLSKKRDKRKSGTRTYRKGKTAGEVVIELMVDESS